jgi:hypothetical protein
MPHTLLVELECFYMRFINFFVEFELYKSNKCCREPSFFQGLEFKRDVVENPQSFNKLKERTEK